MTTAMRTELDFKKEVACLDSSGKSMSFLLERSREERSIAIKQVAKK